MLCLVVVINYNLKVSQALFCLVMVLFLVEKWKVIQQRTSKQLTEISTGTVNVCTVVSFTWAIPVCFIMLNAPSVVNWDISSRSIKLLFPLPLMMINPVVLTLSSWVFLMTTYLYPRFSQVMSISISDYLPPVVHSITVV